MIVITPGQSYGETFGYGGVVTLPNNNGWSAQAALQVSVEEVYAVTITMAAIGANAVDPSKADWAFVLSLDSLATAGLNYTGAPKKNAALRIRFVDTSTPPIVIDAQRIPVQIDEAFPL